MSTTRRHFLAQSAAAAATPAAAWLSNLAAISEASAAPNSDYRALVCIFLNGGNDHANTVVPIDDDHANYLRERPVIAHAKSSVASRPLGSVDGRAYGLSPDMAQLYDAFYPPAGTSGGAQLAVLMNVGPLNEPTVRVGNGVNTPIPYINPDKGSNASIPPRLGSHNDQQLIWQTSEAEGAVRGWGGRIGDYMLSKNFNGLPTFTGIGMAGDECSFLAGERSTPYLITRTRQLSTTIRSTREVVFGSVDVSGAISRILAGSGAISSQSNYLQQDLVNLMRRSINADNLLRSQLRDESSSSPYRALLNINSDFANRLASIAHTMNIGDQTKAKRQVFFVQFGNFDTHSQQRSQHGAMLQQLSRALIAFQSTLNGLGLADKVTTFTASDFGRTLTENNDGTDHGWGGHHFILGGAVKGGLYGRALSHDVASINTSRYAGITYQGAPLKVKETLDRGVPIPTTSVHQYAATLALWMGVPQADLPKVVPGVAPFQNLGNATVASLWPVDLKFMG